MEAILERAFVSAQDMNCGMCHGVETAKCPGAVDNFLSAHCHHLRLLRNYIEA